MKKLKNPSKGGAYFKSSLDVDPVKISGPGRKSPEKATQKPEADTRALAKPEAEAVVTSQPEATDLKGVRSK